MGVLDNPVLNPFYQSHGDKEPDNLVKEAERRNGARYGSFQEAQDEDKTEVADDSSLSSAEHITDDYQEGLQKVEAVAIVWTKWSLVSAYACIYLLFFILSLQSSVFFGLTPYVYSAFELHELVSVSSVMASIIGGVLRLPIGKMIDIWGRAEGFLVMLGVIVLGIIIMAACTNVQTYAAAYVIYFVGYDGIFYVLQVFIADTSRLRNRGLMLAFSQTPYIATAFAGPALAAAFEAHTGWRWGYGTFAIVYPFVAIPLVVVLFKHQRKAEKLGLIKKHRSGRTVLQSIRHYCIEFDVIGLLILMAGLVLFLLPFSLATLETSGWKSADVIAMLVVGFCLILFFPVYEKFLAPKSFIPFKLLKDRTILGACLMIGALFVSFYCWDLYFSSFLQVVFGLSLKDAGYMASIYNIGSCFWGVIVGVLIRYSNRYKWLAICAVPVQILGAGLMIYFRQPGQHIGYVVMCQIFIAFAGGTLVVTNEIAALAAGDHGSVAMVLALINLSSQIGGAIGDSIAGAIWTNTFPKTLERALPAATKADYLTIYASLVEQLSYAQGTATRDAINYAYGVSQKDMCIASTVSLIVVLVGVWMWRDIRLDNKKQVKGNVV